MRAERVIFLGGAVTALTLVIFGVLQWMGVEAGRLIDWVVGAASFWWLLAITTIPWNVHFRAREVLHEAAESVKRGIEVDAERVGYVRRLAGRALGVALMLHACSGAALAALAWFGVTPVGYVTSALALALTALRPAVRAYAYLWGRLQSIDRELHYPREDLVLWHAQLEDVRTRMTLLEARMEAHERDQRDRHQALAQRLDEAHGGLHALERRLDELDHASASARRDLSRELERQIKDVALTTEASVRALSQDSQFLGHMRELIRFFKEA